VKKYWVGSWNQRWVTTWTTGGWGWNKYEWAKYDKTCKAEGMCERGCAAKYKLEKITQKHDDQKKIYEAVKKQVDEKEKAAKTLKGGDLAKANGEISTLKK